MTTDVCPLEVTQAEYDSFSKAEAVVVREYERVDGSRYAKAVAWGDADEMADQAAIPGIFIVPVGVKIIQQKAIPVSELLG